MRHPSLAEDVESALAHNLALLGWVAQRVREARTGRRRAQFFREFGRVLDGRFCAMELVVMPELKARGCPCEVSMGVFVHVVLRPELGQMLQEDLTLASFQGRVSQFVERALDHLQREALMLAPCTRRLLSLEDSLLLGRQVKAHLGERNAVPADAVRPLTTPASRPKDS
jgi:hypothetical protein